MSKKEAGRKPHSAAQFHHAYTKLVARHAEPVEVVARILAEKLKEQKLSHAGPADYLLQVAAQLLANPSVEDSVAVRLAIKDPGDNESVEIRLSRQDVQSAIEKIYDAIEDVSHEIFKSLADVALDGVLEGAKDCLLRIAVERSHFEQCLEETWRRSFELLDVHVGLCADIGAARNEWLRRRRRRSKDIVVVDAVTRLHGRALHIAGEIRALLRAGFAEGALSRWRTAHEISTTAMFIAARGTDVAERYLAHVGAEKTKSMRQYKAYTTALGYRNISNREQLRLDRLSDDLVKRYGNAFLGDYGWAADALGIRSPTFAQIEKAVDLDRFRPYFRLASGAVHAGPKGTLFRLGVPNGLDAILVGPSSFGLSEAARLMAFSLLQVTSVLLMLHPNTDSVVWMRVLTSLCLKTEQQFVKTERKMARHLSTLQAY